MSRVRTLTLAEWFLIHQLRPIWAEYQQLPALIDLDVTALVAATERAGLRFSPTATVVKAAALLLERRPALNRMLFHTPIGMRILEFSEAKVNLPVMIENRGDPVLSAMVIDKAPERSATELHQEIRAFAASDLSDKPIGRFVHTRGNWWWNRLLLRLLYLCAHRLPWLYRKHGGAISVTSLMRRNQQGFTLRGVAYGQTALTLLVSGLHRGEDGRSLLSLGIAHNHSVLGGDEFHEACLTLSALFQDDPVGTFYPELKEASASAPAQR